MVWIRSSDFLATPPKGRRRRRLLQAGTIDEQTGATRFTAARFGKAQGAGHGNRARQEIRRILPEGKTILELGSGVGTVYLAKFYRMISIESERSWIGLSDSAYLYAPIKDGWYDLSDIELPGHFALALVDGPPRYLASRMPFYERLATRCDAIVVDDVDDPTYADEITAWAARHGRQVDFVPERAALIRKLEPKEQAA